MELAAAPEVRSDPGRDTADRAARTGWLLLLGLLLTFVASKAILYDTLDPDSFWHLRVAEQLQAEGIRPVVDHLSFMSMKTPWSPYSWLGELGMKAIWNWGGFRAAIAVQSMMIASIFALVALASSARAGASCVMSSSSARVAVAPKGHAFAASKSAPSGRPLRGDATRSGTGGGSRVGVLVVTFAAAYLSLPYLSFRPATASLVLFAIAVWLLIRDRRLDERSRAVWLIVPITIVSVNIHLFATVIPLSVAALLAGAICERRGIARYASLLFLTALACSATPMLPGLIRTMWFYQTGGSMVSGSGIAELRPFYAGPMGWLSASIVIAGFVACWIGRSRLRAGEWFWMLGGAILLLRMGRFSPLFVIIAAPIVAVALPPMRGAILGKPVIRLALASLFCIGIVRIIAGFPGRDTSLDTWLNRMGPDTPGYPCGAAAYVQRNIGPTNGRILNDFSWGGYLDWRLGPTFQTFIDGRTQCYAPAFWQTASLGSPDELVPLLKPIAADAAIVRKDRGALRSAVVAMKWKCVFSDDRAEVFVPPGNDLAAVTN